jgi:hypothetical protein
MFSIRMIRPTFMAKKLFAPSRNFVNVGDEVKINFVKGIQLFEFGFFVFSLLFISNSCV